MRRTLITALVACSAITLTFAGAQATDVLSQDAKPHVLTVTSANGQKTVEIAAKGDARNICEGCTIALENGQMVTPKAGDIVFLDKDALEIYED